MPHDVAETGSSGRSWPIGWFDPSNLHFASLALICSDPRCDYCNLTFSAQLFYTITMLKVTDSTGNKHDLGGRLERLVMFIIENSGEIVKPQNAQIVFDCAGGTVSASIKKQLEIQRPEA